MTESKMQAFSSIEYNSQNTSLDVWCIAWEFTRPKRSFAPNPVDVVKVNEAIDSYWLFVDRKIRQNILDSDDEELLTDFMDDLKSRGSEISNLLFTHEMQEVIWRTAAESDIFVISSNIGNIPFEALYSSSYGQSGTFLSENCVIQRTLENGKEIENTASTKDIFSTIVCLDSELACEEKELDLFLTGELGSQGVELVKTTTRNAFGDAIQGASIIHWLCEHTKEGLRLKKDIYFNQRDIDVCKFPSNSILFMLTCRGGRPSVKKDGAVSESLSADIAAASGCTVVAPSSVVAANAAFKFVIAINKILIEEKISRLSDVWSLMKNDLGGRQTDSGITVHKCYLLWFGIYGDCNAHIKSGE